MNQSSLSVTAGLALACLLASFAVPQQGHAGKGDANTQIAVANDGIGLSFAADTDRQFLSMTVRVAAPGQGVVFSRRSLEPVVQWMPDPDAPDGHYRWEAWVVTADSGAVAAPGHASRPPARQMEKSSPDRSVPIEQRFPDAVKQVRHESGMLELRDGWLRDVSGTGQDLSALESAVGKILSFVVPPAQAIQTFTENVEIETTTPRLFFDDTDLSGSNWILEGNSFGFFLTDSQASTSPFIVSDGAPSNSLRIVNTGRIGLGTLNPSRSLQIAQEDPSFSLLETDASTRWNLRSFNGDFHLQHFITGGSFRSPFQIESDAPGDALYVDTSGRVGLGTDTPTERLTITGSSPGPSIGMRNNSGTQWNLESFNGDFRLSHFNGSFRSPLQIESDAPGESVYVDTFGRVGLGVNNPTEHLTISGGSFGPSIGMRTNSGTETWQLGGNTGQFFFRDQSTAAIPFAVSTGAPANSLKVDASGNLGVGIFSPTAPLHVARTDGSAQVLVEDSGSSSPLQMFKLVNSGFPAFNLQDTSQADVSWTFRISGTQGSDERFTITKLGTGEPEFALFHDGSAEFAGPVTANGVLLSSSRAVKTDFSAVDVQTVLDKVAALDVSQWRYRREPGSERHIGPMAEDFQEVFGLGDGRHISAGDAQGILFAAAKALKVENESFKTENRELRAELDEVRTAIAELRARLD